MNKYADKILTIGLVLILIGCTQFKIRTKIKDASVNHLADSSKVIVFSLNQTVPESSKLLGNSKIVGRADTSCDVEQLIKVAEKQARKTGGNIIKVTEVKKPKTGVHNYCYEIKVDIYYYEHIEDIANGQDSVQDSITKYKFKDSATFAILNIYRPGNPLAALAGFDIFRPPGVLPGGEYNT